MYRNGRKLPNERPARLLISKQLAHCFHFKNAAAKAKALKIYGPAVLRMDWRIVKAMAKELDLSLFKVVEIKLGTYARIPIADRPKRAKTAKEIGGLLAALFQRAKVNAKG